jgi:hypothetical protein
VRAHRGLKFILISINSGMTTRHRIKPKIDRLRRRPKKTASNARISREPFGEAPIKVLPIPTFIDDYNHYIGGIY